MAHNTGTSARIQRLTSLVATLLIAVSTAWAFGRVFEGKPPSLRLLGAGIASALIAWSLERRSLLLAVALSGTLMVVAVGFLVFRDTTWHGLPTLETLRQAASAAGEVGEQARIQVAPTPAVPPLMLAGITAVWAAVFSCHSLAFRAGSPLLSLVPPVALIAFADTVLEEFVKPLYGVIFLLAAIAVAFADGLRRVQGWGPMWTGPGSRNHLTSTTGRGARRVAVSTLAVALMAPLLIPGFGSKAVIDLSSGSAGGQVNIDPLVSIGAQLNAAQPVEVFRVQASQATYWRMIALTNFDGVSFLPDVTDPGQELTDGVVPTAFPDAGGEQVDQEFEVTSDLGYPWLPAATIPAVITTDRTIRWDARSQTATVDEPLQAGDGYSVTSFVPQPSPDALRQLQVDQGDASLLQLPTGMPHELVDLAQRWTRDALTPYDKVLAIQNHLRDTSVFHYSTEVDYTADVDTLVKFLYKTRKGFCQQFAVSMAVLLRSIGIPARLAVGFTAGIEVGVGVRSVTTQNLHSWVEVPFPGYGWLSFEPTPAFSDPAAASYQHPITVPTCNPAKPSCTDPTQVDPPPDQGTATPPPLNHRRNDLGPAQGLEDLGTGTDPDAGDRGWIHRPAFLVGALGLLAVLMLLSVPLTRALGRRRRLRRAGADPRRLLLATYDVFTERAGDLGLGRAPEETPQEYRRRVASSGRVSPGRLDQLTSLTVRAAFAAQAPSARDAERASEDAQETLQELQKNAPILQRVRGPFRRER